MRTSSYETSACSEAKDRNKLELLRQENILRESIERRDNMEDTRACAYNKWLAKVIEDGGFYHDVESEPGSEEQTWKTPLAGKEIWSRILLEGQSAPSAWRKTNPTKIHRSDEEAFLKRMFSNKCADGDWGNFSKIDAAKAEAESIIIRLSELKEWINSNKAPNQAQPRFALKPIALLMEEYTSKAARETGRLLQSEGKIERVQPAAHLRIQGSVRPQDQEGAGAEARHERCCSEHGLLRRARLPPRILRLPRLHGTGTSRQQQHDDRSCLPHLHRMLAIAHCSGAVKDVVKNVSGCAPTSRDRSFYGVARGSFSFTIGTSAQRSFAS